MAHKARRRSSWKKARLRTLSISDKWLRTVVALRDIKLSWGRNSSRKKLIPVVLGPTYIMTKKPLHWREFTPVDPETHNGRTYRYGLKPAEGHAVWHSEVAIVRAWCFEHLPEDSFRNYGDFFLFDSEEGSLAFFLRWNGQEIS